MKYGLLQTIFWIMLFLALALLPMAVALLGSKPPAREFWIEFGVMLGFLGFGILILQFVITGRYRWFGAGFSLDNLLQFHKVTGIFALLLILAHPAVLITADPDFLAYFDPRENLPRALALSYISVAVIVLVASSLWRLTFRLSYERWRLVHGVLSFSILFLGLGHMLMVQHYTEPIWKAGAFVVLCGAGLYLLVHSRVVRPRLMRRRPYRLLGVRPEISDGFTLVLEPDGHRFNKWRSGQFTWVTVGDSPFSMQQHPFSLASSPLQGQVELTMKAFGDFTSAAAKLEPGTRIWLEGPYGAFYHEPEKHTGAVFVAGGVGITPIMSMLRTARESNDPSPYLLIYGNKNWDDIIFREELEAMEKLINLKVVHVLEEAHEGWKGEEGFIDEDVLRRHVPEDREAYAYYICGPEKMIDLSESSLRDLGVPAPQIFSERFNMV